MRPLRLDYRRQSPAVGPSDLLRLATAATLLVALIVYGVSLEHELARLESAQTKTSGGSAGRDPRIIAVQVREAHATAARLSFAWDELFAAIERATEGKEIALLAIQPDIVAREVRLTGEAKGLEETLHYVEALSATKTLARVHLAQHQTLNEPDRPIRFVIVASWPQS